MSFVLVDKPRPHVTLITLNRPERMNAMAFDVMIPLRQRIEEVSVDNDTRVVVLTGRDVDAAEAERIGLVSQVVTGELLLETCYAMAERIMGYSRVGIEVTKRMLWSSLDASSLTAHMDHEGIAQLYVRLTTQNFEEAVRARKEKRTPVYED